MNKLLESVDSFGIPLAENAEDDVEALLRAMGSTGEVRMIEFDGEFHPKTDKDRMLLRKLGLPETFSDAQYDSVLAGLGKVGLGIAYEPDEDSLLGEDFKTSAKRFVDQGAEQAEVDQYFTQFKSMKQRIQEPEKKDIDRWSSWEEFKAFVDELKGTKSKSQLKKAGQEHIGQDVPGATLVAEDPYWWVYKIDTYEAARKIGSKTKWCIVASENHWENYRGSKFFFYISKRLKPSVKWYKIAAQVQDGDIIYWDAEDQSHQGGDRSIPFKIPALPESELATAEDEAKLITVYLNKDISDEDLKVLEQSLDILLRFRGGFQLAAGSKSINIELNNPGYFRGRESQAGELVYAIKVTLKDMGYGVEEIAWSMDQRF